MSSLSSDRWQRLPQSVRNSLEILVENSYVQKLILFGSRAVGDNDERSDFDIAISAPTITKADFTHIRDAIGHARTLFIISVTVLEFMPPKLRLRVLEQGETLYERLNRAGFAGGSKP
jgi:predicted nucleotidyltransferase